MRPPPSPASPQTPRRENRLGRGGVGGETSPYLLQHRHNPVDWFPWGQEAFDEARRRDVPIFLSIGYSTCYWCHVMERESFESDEIAALMNRLFVCIKVDREERPDVDDLYMTAVQAFSGHGGWPMSVFLEPASLRPFWAGTYFPATPIRAGMPTFPSVLEGVSRAWTQQRDEVVQQAAELADAVRERTAARQAPARLGAEHVSAAVGTLLKMLDRTWGGFGPAPKFPQPVFLDLLLETRAVADDDTRAAIDAALRLTLDRMALGGLFDQAGGGFHRYSVDEKWLVPHFEKMLYDNAQLASVYARAAVAYADTFYERIACRTLDYALREMRPETGEAGGSKPRGFFSAQDAEVNHREGQNYLWTRAQIEAVLNTDDAAFAIRVFSVTDGPNFRDPHHPDDAPSNILWLKKRPSELAAMLDMPECDFLSRLDEVCAKFYNARSLRDQPITDDKAIAGWNGLMIGALATAGAALDRPDYIEAARGAADFLLSSLRDGAGGLLRTWRAGAAKIPAFLDDYACVIHGLIALHRAGVDPARQYLRSARELVQSAQRLFGEPAAGTTASGMLFDTRAAQSDLFVRARSVHDGALPSGSSVMLHNFIDLHEVGGNGDDLDHALSLLASISGEIALSPLAAANSIRALLRLLTTNRDKFATTVGSLPEPNEPAEGDRPSDPVEILAAVERIVLSPDQPAALTLKFNIAPGYHINAAAPGGPRGIADNLIGLRVRIVGGTGVGVFADYPEGEPYGPDDSLRVHSGAFDLRIVLERDGDWSGRPLLAVTYQPCRDDACLAPRTVELDIAIDRK